jgi:myo-inositol-1(or 4)-monophosphatase
MSTHLQFASKIARKAGQALAEIFDPNGTRANRKSDKSLVTDADIAADRLITAALQDQYPQDQIISEEKTTQISDATRPTWVVDPIDGTTNYSLGLNIWGVSIARVENGWPVVGVLYFPLLNQLYQAQLGAGAYLNNQSIQVSHPEKKLLDTFFVSCPHTWQNYNVKIPYKNRVFGCATYEMSLVARGAAIIGFHSRLKIWDVAAAWLLIKEAGGTIKPYSGPAAFPLQASIDYSTTNYPTVMGADYNETQKGLANIRERNKKEKG